MALESDLQKLVWRIDEQQIKSLAVFLLAGTNQTTLRKLMAEQSCDSLMSSAQNSLDSVQLALFREVINHFEQVHTNSVALAQQLAVLFSPEIQSELELQAGLVDRRVVLYVLTNWLGREIIWEPKTAEGNIAERELRDEK